MSKKIFFSFLIFSLLVIASFSNSFANTNIINNAKNTVMNAGNTVGNAAMNTKNAVVNGATNLTNGAKTLGQDAANATTNIGNDTRNVVGTTANVLDNGNTNYIATRTATNGNLLGMSSTAWTWLVLGIVGIVIVALVWYYGKQYEHRNYNND